MFSKDTYGEQFSQCRLVKGGWWCTDMGQFYTKNEYMYISNNSLGHQPK